MGMAIGCRDYDEQQAKNKPQKLACYRRRIFAYLPVRKIRSSKNTCPNGFKNLSHILPPLYGSNDSPDDRRHYSKINISAYRFGTKKIFSDFATLAFRGMILAIKEQSFMALPPFQQNRLGKILLGVSIIFVVLFAITLVMNWISDPDMFRPVFGN